MNTLPCLSPARARPRVSRRARHRPRVTLDRAATCRSPLPRARPSTRARPSPRARDASPDASSRPRARVDAPCTRACVPTTRAASRPHSRAAMRCVGASRATGAVTRVARVGRRLTFVDVLASEPVRWRDGETTTVRARVRDEVVSRRVRPGATVTFEWVEQAGGERDGAYVDASGMVVIAAAPARSVANATAALVEKYGRREVREDGGGEGSSGGRLIDPRARVEGGGMSTFGVCKTALGGGTCRDENCVRRHDPSAEELRMARESRERARERSRRAIEAERCEEDPHGEANKEAKGVSDRIFANFCVETFGLKRKGKDSSLVADIAGGSGTLSFEFHVNHGIGCVLIEPHCVSLTPRQRATWSNLRRRGAREDASAEARDAWLRSELWVECADEQKETRLREHFTRLVAYTEIATDEDIQEVSASAPPTDLAALVSAPFDEFPTKLPRTVAKAQVAPAPFTHIRSEFWALESSVGERLRAMQPDLLVGMHPDQATEGIIDAALELNLPFAVVPCCTFPELFPHRRTSSGEPVASYSDFVDYLCAKHPSIRRTFLPFKGRNQVLYRTTNS